MKEILIHGGLKCMVDDEDFDAVSKHHWHVNKGAGNRPYARGSIFNSETKIRKNCSMHRFIMNMQNPKLKIDHIDGDGLNNQKSNLRICSDSQNMFNRAKNKNSSSKYKGVSFVKAEGNYICRLNYKKAPWYIGHYNCEIEAALAYNVAASFAFREFAKLNKVEV